VSVTGDMILIEDEITDRRNIMVKRDCKNNVHKVFNTLFNSVTQSMQFGVFKEVKISIVVFYVMTVLSCFRPCELLNSLIDKGFVDLRN
jgi:hypothetical protein